jgi:hypothetical protein
VAAVLVVGVGGHLVVRSALDRAPSTASRVAGHLLGCLAVAVLLVAVVLAAAGLQAAGIGAAADAERPSGPFIRYLLDADPDTTQRAATYGAAVLVPLAGVLAVLALAALDPARTVGLRAAQALAGAAVAVGALLVATGDTGPLVARSAAGMAAVAAGALGALAVDELTQPRRRDP